MQSHKLNEGSAWPEEWNVKHEMGQGRKVMICRKWISEKEQGEGKGKVEGNGEGEGK